MNATQQRNELLETLTVTVTAFGNWGEFKAAMQAGYCPTLRDRKLPKNASRQNRQHEKATRVLNALVRQEGFKVFDGVKVA